MTACVATCATSSTLQDDHSDKGDVRSDRLSASADDLTASLARIQLNDKESTSQSNGGPLRSSGSKVKLRSQCLPKDSNGDEDEEDETGSLDGKSSASDDSKGAKEASEPDARCPEGRPTSTFFPDASGFVQSVTQLSGGRTKRGMEHVRDGYISNKFVNDQSGPYQHYNQQLPYTTIADPNHMYQQVYHYPPYQQQYNQHLNTVPTSSSFEVGASSPSSAMSMSSDQVLCSPSHPFGSVQTTYYQNQMPNYPTQPTPPYLPSPGTSVPSPPSASLQSPLGSSSYQNVPSPCDSYLSSQHSVFSPGSSHSSALDELSMYPPQNQPVYKQNGGPHRPKVMSTDIPHLDLNDLECLANTFDNNFDTSSYGPIHANPAGNFSPPTGQPNVHQHWQNAQNGQMQGYPQNYSFYPGPNGVTVSSPVLPPVTTIDGKVAISSPPTTTAATPQIIQVVIVPAPPVPKQRNIAPKPGPNGQPIATEESTKKVTPGRKTKTKKSTSGTTTGKKAEEEALRKAMEELSAKPDAELLSHLQNGETCLTQAIKDKNKQRITAVLKVVANRKETLVPLIDMANNEKQTPLMLAVKVKFLWLFEYLLYNFKAKSDELIGLQDEDGSTGTVLHFIARQSDDYKQYMETLFEKSINPPTVDYTCSSGLTALHLAIQYHHPRTNNSIQLIKTLLKHRAGCDVRDNKNGRTALQFAVEKGSYEVVETILGSNNSSLLVDAQNYEHRTALHLAAGLRLPEAEKIEIVRLLLNNRANKRLRDNHRSLAKDYCSASEHELRSLLDDGAFL